MKENQIETMGEHSQGYFALFERLIPNLVRPESPDIQQISHFLEGYVNKSADSERYRLYVTDLWTGKIVYSSKNNNSIYESNLLDNKIVSINDLFKDLSSRYQLLHRQLLSDQIDFAKAMHPQLYGSFFAVKHICQKSSNGKLFNIQVVDYLIADAGGEIPRYVLNKVSIPKYEYDEYPPSYLYLKGSGMAPKFLIYKPSVDGGSVFKSLLLTRTELNCFSVMLENDRTDYISEKLFISKHTVNTYKKNLFAKLGVRSITSLIKLGFAMGVTSDH